MGVVFPRRDALACQRKYCIVVVQHTGDLDQGMHPVGNAFALVHIVLRTIYPTRNFMQRFYDVRFVNRECELA